MNISDNTLKYDEKVMFALRSLYSSYGYDQFKMNKFEEYDLYVRNKDFLISDNVITFTDTTGKLMALKPDVTLSIIKNTKDCTDSVTKLYYNENVYRVSKGTHEFKEIMQVGLECIGNIDDYCICETLLLAAESLKAITDDSVLEISHLGIISEILKSLDISTETSSLIYKLISEKNIHELSEVCIGLGIGENTRKMLINLISTYGRPCDVLPELNKIFENIPDKSAINQLEKIVSVFEGGAYEDMLRIDFSVVNDINYYNGIVFKGFVNGIPISVLSGGQYDRLMKRMNRKSKAIGFAVYLDALEQFSYLEKEYDVDILLTYDESSAIDDILNVANKLINSGKSVIIQKTVPAEIKYRQLAKIINGEVKFCENNA